MKKTYVSVGVQASEQEREKMGLAVKPMIFKVECEEHWQMLLQRVDECGGLNFDED